MKKFVFILIVTACIAFTFIGFNFRTIVYPPQPSQQKSPKAYLDKAGTLLPEAASTSLIVEEHGNRNKPLVALTFDADMTPGMVAMLKTGIAKSWYNREVKTVLDDLHAKGTVFLGGLWTETYPTEAKELADDPLIEIGNHSYNHYAFANSCYSLPFISDGDDHDDVMHAQNVIWKTTGVLPKYFRFPGGCYESVDVKSVADLGLRIVHWDVVAGDGFNTNTDSIVRAAETNVQNGSIIVMHIHDGSYAPKTAEALKRIIPDLRARGFEFAKVSEILE